MTLRYALPRRPRVRWYSLAQVQQMEAAEVRRQKRKAARREAIRQAVQSRQLNGNVSK